MAEAKNAEPADVKGLEGAKIRWDDANMKSSYANVCNVTSTREEVVMLFGINQAWNRGQKEVTIQLTDRIIISPYAAKRLAMPSPNPDPAPVTIAILFSSRMKGLVTGRQHAYAASATLWNPAHGLRKPSAYGNDRAVSCTWRSSRAR